MALTGNNILIPFNYWSHCNSLETRMVVHDTSRVPKIVSRITSTESLISCLSYRKDLVQIAYSVFNWYSCIFQVVLMLVVLLVVFVICWLPFQVVLLYAEYTHDTRVMVSMDRSAPRGSNTTNHNLRNISWWINFYGDLYIILSYGILSIGDFYCVSSLIRHPYTHLVLYNNRLC